MISLPASNVSVYFTFGGLPLPPSLILVTMEASANLFDLTSLQPGWQDAVKTAKQAGIPVIAYGPHVQTELRKEALEAGCDEVYANSKFTLDLSNILQKALG